jgi:cyclohexyl-isocyanide hydratase
VLRNRRATTHWASFSLLPLFGARAVDERVVVDGLIVSAAGVTAGIDGALRLAALLRGDDAAQKIQLDIQYSPEPPFNAGDPRTAPAGIVDALRENYRPITEARTRTAQEFAGRNR